MSLSTHEILLTSIVADVFTPFYRLSDCIHLSSSASCCAISTDILDPLSPPLPIVHSFPRVFRDTSRDGTDLLYVGSSWSSCLCSSM